MDIKKSFLEDKVEENISIKMPTILQEMNTKFKDSKFSKLNKSVYGLVQPEKNFYLETINYLKTKDYQVYEG